MALIMPNGSYTRPLPQATPSKPGPGRPSMPQYGQPGGMTPSKPGPAQPSVPMMQNYAPGQAQPQQSPYATSAPYGQPPLTQYYAGSSPSGQPPQPSLTQYTAPGNPLPGPTSRPAPFRSTTRNFDGTTSEMPNFQQRDAFIGQINNQLGQMQNQSWQQPGMGAPQFDFPTMWGQAGEMAQQGFQNPFAAQDPGNQIRRLMSPTATPGGSINQNAQPGGSGLPDFARPVLKAPGSPGDPSPPPASPARPPAPRPPAAPTSGSNSSSIERLAADPNLTPSQKAAKFLEANRESIKNGTFRNADVDALGLPSTDARLLKNKVNTQTLSFDRLRKSKEVSKMFPNYGIPQSAYAAFAKKYG